MQELHFRTTKLIRLFIFICISMMASCDSVFEEDISDDLVIIKNPTSNDTIRASLVSFRWELLDGATEYQMQLAKPEFNSFNAFVLDSITVNYEINIPLVSGDYEWRIRAINNGYETNFIDPVVFVVDSIADQL